MVNKGLTMYHCCICGSDTTQLHEIIFGSANRKICIEYNLQVPLCSKHHDISHGKKHIPVNCEYDCMSQSQCYTHFCDILRIDPFKTFREVKNKSERHYLDTISESCSNIIRGFEK